MPLVKEPQAEPIPGYYLIEPLGRGGYGEVWKCEAPGGLLKAIKFVPESDDLDDVPGPASEELRAIQYIKSLRHPFLLSMERVELLNGELVIVMELADRSLKDVLNQRRADGLAGLERRELLAYLREAADVLDLINVQHGLQHLDIKPANLFVVSGHVKVADFGLVHSLHERSSKGGTFAAVTPSYGAPELYKGQVSPHCDQYSLAIVYFELLTGQLPFHAQSARQMALAHCTKDPDLSALLEVERPILLQALAKDPASRFSCCRAMIDALEQVTATDSGVYCQLPAERATWTSTLPDLSPLGLAHRYTTGETWLARDREGRAWRVGVLQGLTGKFRDGVNRLQALNHGSLAPRRILSGEHGAILLAQQTGEGSLANRLQIEKQRGNKGLQRGQLLCWLGEAAGALDELALRGVPHLGLSPRLLYTHGESLWVADHGLVALLGQAPAPRYAAPEVVQELGGLQSDVYSLACIYQELLTGIHPLAGRRLDQPNLGALPVCDRDLIRAALSLDPAGRPARCWDLIERLIQVSPSRQLSIGLHQQVLSASSEEPVCLEVGLSGPRRALADLIGEVADAAPDHVPDRWQVLPRGRLALSTVFPAPVPRETVRPLFNAFRERWKGKLKEDSETHLCFEVSGPTPFWKRWMGRVPTLTVELSWQPATPPASLEPEIRARVQGPCLRGDDQALLREMAPALLDDLRTSVQATPDRRSEKRILFGNPLQASLVLDTDDALHHIEAQGKDLSLTGVGLFLPPIEPGRLVQINLSSTTRPKPVVMAGTCVRSRRVDGDRYEAGFLLEC
jgi:serine/threonine protein kinase